VDATVFIRQTMAGYYQYPIEHQDEFLGTISFEAMVEPPIEATLFGGGGGADQRREGAVDYDVQSQLFGIPRSPISPGINGVSSDGKVTLFLPRAFQIQDGVSYDNNVNLGQIGAAAAGLVANGASIAGATSGAISGSIQSFIDGMSNGGGDLARLAAVRIGDNVNAISPEFNNAVKSIAQVVPNPNTRTLFRGVAMRAFMFDFSLIANSVREAQEIKNIIRFFRTQLYPADIGGTASTQGVLGLKFPNKFEIKVKYRDKDLGIRFLPCYLTAFSATYNEQGGAMHKDGGWNSVQIQLSFSETRTLVKQDIEAGY
jgi:hypothetical protein